MATEKPTLAAPEEEQRLCPTEDVQSSSVLTESVVSESPEVLDPAKASESEGAVAEIESRPAEPAEEDAEPVAQEAGSDADGEPTDVADETIDEPTEEPTDVADEPIEEPTDETIDETAKPVDEPTEEPVDEPIEEPTDETAEPTDNTIDEPIDELVDEADRSSDESSVEERFSGKSKTELLDLFERMLAEQPVPSIRRDAEALKVAFYRLRRAEVETARRAFIESGGTEETFVPTVDGAEVRLKDLFKEYRLRRDEFIAGLEAEKEQNYRTKLAIIDELKELIDSDETLNHTFTKFRELQQRWKETGPVPVQYVKDLWETYNLHVENFYNFIKINKELRDLDLKKNYEQKVALCEQAEALLLEPSVVEAFHKLQKLHDEWRETGPVANECKEALWERFKAASSRINKQHQAHFEALKAEQVKNLELKTELCVAVEELCGQPSTTRKEWNKASERLLEIQKTWKTIGFAPKKENNAIYERFRVACDRFFEGKRRFYAGFKTEMEHNLQLKNELCEAAEALSESEEWKSATEELIALQARWKTVGAVSRRHSDAVWKRFRAACDKFFERKAAHFSGVDSEHEENLKKKLALLDEMAAADVAAGGFEVIREFQRRWSEIGFVPIKQKDAVQKRYKAVVDALFDTLRGSERDRSMNRFRDKVSSLKASGDRRLRSERERLYNKVRQMEQEIALLENNIGFFAKSKNADALVADVQAKIDRIRTEMAAAIEKVKLIDREADQETARTENEEEQ